MTNFIFIILTLILIYVLYRVFLKVDLDFDIYYNSQKLNAIFYTFVAIVYILLVLILIFQWDYIISINYFHNLLVKEWNVSILSLPRVLAIGWIFIGIGMPFNFVMYFVLKQFDKN